MRFVFDLEVPDVPWDYIWSVEDLPSRAEARKHARHLVHAQARPGTRCVVRALGAPLFTVG